MLWDTQRRKMRAIFDVNDIATCLIALNFYPLWIGLAILL